MRNSNLLIVHKKEGHCQLPKPFSLYPKIPTRGPDGSVGLEVAHINPSQGLVV